MCLQYIPIKIGDPILPQLPHRQRELSQSLLKVMTTGLHKLPAFHYDELFACLLSGWPSLFLHLAYHDQGTVKKNNF